MSANPGQYTTLYNLQLAAQKHLSNNILEDYLNLPHKQAPGAPQILYVTSPKLSVKLNLINPYETERCTEYVHCEI